MVSNAAKIIQHIKKGDTPRNFEIIEGTGIYFSDDVWRLQKDGNEHQAACKTTVTFKGYGSEKLKNVAKSYLLESYKFNISAATSTHYMAQTIRHFMNFLSDCRIERLRDVNSHIIKEYHNHLSKLALERNWSPHTVNSYLAIVNKLTKSCVYCSDSIPNKHYLERKILTRMANRIAPKESGKTLLIPDSVARKIIKSAISVLNEELPKCFEDAEGFEAVKQLRPKTWKNLLASKKNLSNAKVDNPFKNYGSKEEFNMALQNIQIALQIYILFFTGMRANELINLETNDCNKSSDNNLCELLGHIKKGGGLREKNTYVWFAPIEVKRYVDQFNKLKEMAEIPSKFIISGVQNRNTGKRITNSSSVLGSIQKFCNERNLLEMNNGKQWQIKTHQFRTHYVHFMTQNHLNFSIISEQMKHTILDQTFGYSGPLEGHMAAIVDPGLTSDLRKGQLAYEWKEAEKSLCCETVSSAPEDSQFAHLRNKFKAVVTPKEKDKVIEEYLITGHDPCRMPVGVCVAHYRVRHKCGMRNNPLGCKTSCPNFTCEVHDYGRIVYEKSVEFRKLANDPELASVKRSHYGKMADEFDGLMEEWETAECPNAKA